VRAIAAAERSIHDSPKATVETLARAFPSRDRRELETIVRLYEPAIPDEPDVTAEDIRPGLELFPAGMAKPDLSNIDLRAHVEPKFAAEPRAKRTWWLILAAVIVSALLVTAMVRRRGRAPR
jgi:hypothetical protein